ncbi:MAG: hypothetical protein AABY26_06260 [Nanoarchaeota archaeon]
MIKLTPRQELIKTNLLKAIFEVSRVSLENISIHEIKIKITPVDEPDKNQTSIDDVMNLWFRKDYDYTKIHSIDEAINCISAPHDKFPLWIKVRADYDMNFELQTSKRYRIYRELSNHEKGYPPFEIV